MTGCLLTAWGWIVGAGLMVNLAFQKGWGSFHFPSCPVQEASSLHSLLSSIRTPSYSNSFGSRVPETSDMGVNSSNVDKRTWLILCRCVSELREGTLCCPRWREKGLSSMNYEQKTPVTQYSWFWLPVWVSREEKGVNQGANVHSFHPLEEVLVCRITGVYVSHWLKHT